MQLIFEFGTNSLTFSMLNLWWKLVINITSCDVEYHNLWFPNNNKSSGIIRHHPHPSSPTHRPTEPWNVSKASRTKSRIRFCALTELVSTEITSCEHRHHKLWSSMLTSSATVQKRIMLLFVELPEVLQGPIGRWVGEVGCGWVALYGMVPELLFLFANITSCDAQHHNLWCRFRAYITTWATKKSPNWSKTQKSIALGRSISKSSVERCTGVVHRVPPRAVISVQSCDVEDHKFSQLRGSRSSRSHNGALVILTSIRDEVYSWNDCFALPDPACATAIHGFRTGSEVVMLRITSCDASQLGCQQMLRH